MGTGIAVSQTALAREFINEEHRRSIRSPAPGHKETVDADLQAADCE
jgi:hypothetical protein